MKYLIPVLIFCLSFVMLSCADKTKQKSGQEPTAEKRPDSIQTPHNLKSESENTDAIYFRASGTEPFWGLELSENQIKLTTIGDSIVTPHTLPVTAMDTNMKMYKLQTESAEMIVQIVESECTNAMSGKVSPYTVNINYRQNSDEAFTIVEGCGDYITDYRLHDIWVLEELNGEKITPKDFSNEFPAMEINSTTNKFSGFAGCNQMNGSLFYEKGLLYFTNIATTKMMCEPANKEAVFLKALQSSTTYTIGNNRLTLSNPDGVLLIFKKID